MEGDHRPDLPSCEYHGPKNCDPYCAKCYRLLREKHDWYKYVLRKIAGSKTFDSGELIDLADQGLQK